MKYKKGLYDIYLFVFSILKVKTPSYIFVFIIISVFTFPIFVMFFFLILKSITPVNFLRNLVFFKYYDSSQNRKIRNFGWLSIKGTVFP